MSVRSRRGWWIAAFVVALAATLPYLSTLHNYFVQDDFGVVQLLARKPWSYLPVWFRTPWMDDIWGYIPDEIRPFPAVTYQVTALWGAASPVANHVVNIGFHAANALLVLAIARAAAGLSLPSATFAALVFALLPIQTESVAWITGRVDSMPAFFYLASFLAYVRARDVFSDRAGGVSRAATRSSEAHRGEARPSSTRAAAMTLYVAALVLFFVALFTKQNTITMAPALLLFDLLVARRWPARVSFGSLLAWAWWYVPFGLMTIAYLGLRLVVFGEVARESSLNRQGLEYFGTLVQRHLNRLVFGDVSFGTLPHWLMATAVAILIYGIARAFAPAEHRGAGASRASYVDPESHVDPESAIAPLAARDRVGIAARSAHWGTLAYFGPVWLFFGIAPTLVANYESPRHIYLAAVGWAIVLGFACDRLWQAAPKRVWRVVAVSASVVVLALYTRQLLASIDDWNLRARVSQRAVTELERTALTLPEGSLVIAGVPISSWEWALPFAAQPPYTRTDLMARVSIVTPWRLHCCRAQWEGYTRRTLQTWAARADRPPIVALYVDPRSGAVSHLSDRDEPFLRAMIPILLDTRSYDVLDQRMLELLDRAVAGRAGS